MNKQNNNYQKKKKKEEEEKKRKPREDTTISETDPKVQWAEGPDAIGASGKRSNKTMLK